MANPDFDLESQRPQQDGGNEIGLVDLLPGIVRRLATEPETLNGAELELASRIVGAVSKVIDLERERQAAQADLAELLGVEQNVGSAVGVLRRPSDAGSAVLTVVRSGVETPLHSGTESTSSPEISPRAQEIIDFAKVLPNGTILTPHEIISGTSIGWKDDGTPRNYYAALSLFNYHKRSALDSGVIRHNGVTGGGSKYEVLKGMKIGATGRLVPTEQVSAKSLAEHGSVGSIDATLFAEIVMMVGEAGVSSIELADQLEVRTRDVSLFVRSHIKQVNEILATHGKEIVIHKTRHGISYYVVESGKAQELRQNLERRRLEAIEASKKAKEIHNENLRSLADELYSFLATKRDFTSSDIVEFYRNNGVTTNTDSLRDIIYPALNAYALAQGMRVVHVSRRGKPRQAFAAFEQTG